MRKVLHKFLIPVFMALLINSAKANLAADRNFIKADYMLYNSEEDFAEAIGNVEIVTGDNYLKTHRALIDVKNQKIWIDKEIYAENSNQKLIAQSFYHNEHKHISVLRNAEISLKNLEILKAKKAVQYDKDHSELSEASYTPCIKCIKNNPIWSIEAKRTEIDFKKNKIKYHHAFFKIGGFRVAYLPFFMHSMPTKDAVSGILRPELDKGTFKLPLYYRAQPNLDITYSPRFNRKYLIHEMEYRHLLENGKYQINGSFSRSNILIKDNKKLIDKNNIYNRYYFNSFGDFTSDSLSMGYNIGKVSDKSYLKNFYLDHRNYVKSNIYANQFQNNGYNHIDIMHFQGLRTLDSKKTDPSALPNLLLRRDYDIGDNLDLSLEENIVQYNEGSRKNLTRNSLNLELTRRDFFDNGQIIQTSLHNKTDIYSVQKTYSKESNAIRNKNLFRNIPEISTNVTMPLFIPYNENIVVFEPQLNLIIGSKNPYKINKYNLIDSPNYDINENNIFNHSRYSGIDFYEHGTRFSYGINNYAMGEYWQISSFLGQLIKSQTSTTNSKSDYVGKINYNYLDNFEIYYRFQRKNHKFKPNRDEVSIWAKHNKLALQSIWISLRDLQQYHNLYNFSNIPDQNIIKQNNTILSYQITDDLTLFGDIRLDLSTKNKTKVINDSIGAAYTLDCISFSIKVSNDYSYDPTRNIKKNRTYGIKLGLKTINL